MTKVAVNHIELAMDGFNKFNEAITEVARVLGQFTFALVGPRSQQLSYLIYHERLPGSERTSRLRKKRKTRVENWYRRQIKNKAAAMRTESNEWQT